MGDFVTKTKELANLVGSLQQKGEDDSDLTGILAQLQAAIDKRVSSTVENESQDVENREESASLSLSPAAEDEVNMSFEADILDPGTKEKSRVKSPNKKKSASFRKRKTKTTKSTLVKRKVKKEVTLEYNSSDQSELHLVHTLEDGDIRDEDLESEEGGYDSLIDPWTGLLDEDDDTLSDGKSSKVVGNSMTFKDKCKICEVQAVLDKGDTEDQLPITEPTMVEPSDCPIFSSLVTFAAHLKSEHAIPGLVDMDNSNTQVEMSMTENTSEQTNTTVLGPMPSEEVKQEPTDPENAQLQGQQGEFGKLGTGEDGKDMGFLSHKGSSKSYENPSKSNTLFLVCPHCDKSYNLHGTAKSCYDQLVFHMHRKHGEALPLHVTLYSCTECSFQTLRRRDLSRHNFVVHTDHEPRGVPCALCGKCVLPTSMVFHMAAVHGAEDVPDQVKARTAKAPCGICGKEFRGEINLQRHIKCVHNKIKDQLCHLCSQSFFAKRELQLHMFATHKINMSNMKVFRCPAEGCHYETLARRHLFIHSSVHTETKDFTCEHCGKAFKSKPALTQHLRIMHTNDVEYKCTKCNFSSHAKQYVQRHMVIHSEEKRHKCDFEGCTYATHFIENLTKHKKKHRNKIAIQNI